MLYMTAYYNEIFTVLSCTSTKYYRSWSSLTKGHFYPDTLYIVDMFNMVHSACFVIAYLEAPTVIQLLQQLIFTARCYASAVLAMGLCLSVSVSVCLLQADVLLKQQNVGSHKQHHTIPQGL